LFPLAEIDFEALKEGLGKSKYTLIDVRPSEMVAEEGQIPGSNNIPRECKHSTGKINYPYFLLTQVFDVDY
jgi:hypothetical protein